MRNCVRAFARPFREAGMGVRRETCAAKGGFRKSAASGRRHRYGARGSGSRRAGPARQRVPERRVG